MTNDSKTQELVKLHSLLKYTFGFVPIAAGADKFLNLLTDWTQYISGGLTELLPLDAATFMMVVGIIEIGAGIVVIIKTEIGSYVVTAWLMLIALTLLASGSHLDVAVRDIVMAIAAFLLARLTKILNTSGAKFEINTRS